MLPCEEKCSAHEKRVKNYQNPTERGEWSECRHCCIVMCSSVRKKFVQWLVCIFIVFDVKNKTTMLWHISFKCQIAHKTVFKWKTSVNNSWLVVVYVVYLFPLRKPRVVGMCKKISKMLGTIKIVQVKNMLINV